MKTENSMDADDSRPSQTSSEDFVSSQRLKMDSKPLPVHAGKGFSKTLNKRISQDDSNSLASSKKSHNASTVIILFLLLLRIIKNMLKFSFSHRIALKENQLFIIDASIIPNQILQLGNKPFRKRLFS